MPASARPFWRRHPILLGWLALGAVLSGIAIERQLRIRAVAARPSSGEGPVQLSVNLHVGSPGFARMLWVRDADDGAPLCFVGRVPPLTLRDGTPVSLGELDGDVVLHGRFPKGMEIWDEPPLFPETNVPDVCAASVGGHRVALRWAFLDDQTVTIIGCRRGGKIAPCGDGHDAMGTLSLEAITRARLVDKLGVVGAFVAMTGLWSLARLLAQSVSGARKREPS